MRDWPARSHWKARKRPKAARAGHAPHLRGMCVPEILHGATNSFVERHLRAPAQNPFSQTDIEPGPFQVAESRRMKFRVVGRADGSGDRRM
jgi:hypothetical protein